MNFNQLKTALWTLVVKEIRRFMRIGHKPYCHLPSP